MNNSEENISVCTSTNCKCKLFDEIGICKNYGIRNASYIYKRAEDDLIFRNTLKEIKEACPRDEFCKKEIISEKKYNSPIPIIIENDSHIMEQKRYNSPIPIIIDNGYLEKLYFFPRYYSNEDLSKENINILLDNDFYDNIIVDEIDRLNPAKCPVHTHLVSNRILSSNLEKKCIGCKIGLNQENKN